MESLPSKQRKSLKNDEPPRIPHFGSAGLRKNPIFASLTHFIAKIWRVSPVFQQVFLIMKVSINACECCASIDPKWRHDLPLFLKERMRVRPRPAAHAEHLFAREVLGAQDRYVGAKVCWR